MSGLKFREYDKYIVVYVRDVVNKILIRFLK